MDLLLNICLDNTGLDITIRTGNKMGVKGSAYSGNHNTNVQIRVAFCNPMFSVLWTFITLLALDSTFPHFI